MRVIGYVRVCTDEQAITALAYRRSGRRSSRSASGGDGDLVRVITDEGFSAKDMRRPGVQEAIRVLEAGEAGALVVTAKFDAESVDGRVLRAHGARAKAGMGALALDCVDTTSPSGEAMANMLATFAQFERRLISQRTRDALAVKRAQGVRLGRPRTLPDAIRERIVRERKNGASLTAIAAKLNAEDVSTAHGGTWWPSTVAKIAATGIKGPLEPAR